jgi:hypothetical protein
LFIVVDKILPLGIVDSLPVGRSAVIHSLVSSNVVYRIPISITSPVFEFISILSPTEYTLVM